MTYQEPTYTKDEQGHRKRRWILQRGSDLSECTYSAAVALSPDIFPFALNDGTVEIALQRSSLPSPTSRYSLHFLSYTEKMTQKEQPVFSKLNNLLTVRGHMGRTSAAFSRISVPSVIIFCSRCPFLADSEPYFRPLLAAVI